MEKALSQSLGGPTLISISQAIASRKKEYYEALSSCNRTLDVQQWLFYFADVIVQSQAESLAMINFLLAKARLMTELRDKLNEREEKALLRMLREGTQGFAGGLSAENYIRITKKLY